MLTAIHVEFGTEGLFELIETCSLMQLYAVLFIIFVHDKLSTWAIIQAARLLWAL
jgi:hypothetical protein